MTWAIRVRIAPGGSPTADPDTLTWVDITQYVKPRITVTRGRQDEQGQTQPAACSLQVDNAGGRFTRLNPLAPWYPALQRGCPIRVEVNLGSGWVTRFTGYVDAWPVRWAPGETVCYVEVTASGVLRRLIRSESPTRGALYRYITGSLTANLLAYWPMEDASGSQSAASAVEGVGPLSVGGSVTFGAQAPPSGLSAMVNPSGGYLAGDLPESSSTSWRVEFALTIDEPTTVNSRPLAWITNGGARSWNVVITPAGLHLDGYSTDAALVTTQIVDIDTNFIPTPGQLHHVRVDMNSLGIEIRMYVDGVQYGVTDTVADPVTPPTHIRVNADWASAVPRVAGLAVWASLPTSVTPDAARGWIGQQAHQRVESVCADAGIPYSPVLGATVSSEVMGPQPAGSPATVLRDAETTDGGILYERTAGQLTYLRRAARYNQAVALAATYSQLAPPLRATDDDQRLHNVVTATRPAGSSATYVVDESVAVEGRHEDPATVDTQFDARLIQHAAWLARLGSIDELRFETIGLNFRGGAAPLAAQWLASDIGSRMTISGTLVGLPPGTADLVIEGYTETIDKVEWRADLTCSPYTPYVVGVRNSTSLGRRDTAGSVLAAGVAAGATTLSVATIKGPLWTTGPVDFDIVASGVRLHVTNISGGVSPQTFTVSSTPVNGVVKALQADTPIRLYQPARRAL